MATASVDTDNIVYISAECKQKENRLVARMDAEIGWFGVVEELDGYPYVVDILVPKQEVSGSAVDYDELGLAELLEENIDVCDKIKYFGHSHVNMSSYFSGVDTGNFIQKMMSVPGCNSFICHVQNKKGESQTRMDLKIPFRCTISMRQIIVVPDDVEAWAKEAIDTNVSKKAQVSHHQVAGGKHSVGRHPRVGQNKQLGSGSATRSDEKVLVVNSIAAVPEKGRAVFYDTAGRRNEFKDGALVGLKAPGRSVQRSEAKRAEGKVEEPTTKKEGSKPTLTASEAKKEERDKNEEQKQKQQQKLLEQKVSREQQASREPSAQELEDEAIADQLDQIDAQIDELFDGFKEEIRSVTQLALISTMEEVEIS